VKVSRAPADLRIRARPKSFRQLRAELNLDWSLRRFERLQVRVRHQKFDSFESGGNHPVHGIPASATYSNHFDFGAAPDVI
jgi:hypothetical protein